MKGAEDGGGLEFNANRMGFDFRDMDLPKADPKACQASCDRDAKCVAWTVLEAWGSGRTGALLAERPVPEPSEDENCISGIKRINLKP